MVEMALLIYIYIIYIYILFVRAPLFDGGAGLRDSWDAGGCGGVAGRRQTTQT